MKHFIFFIFLLFIFASCEQDHTQRPEGFEVYGIDLSRYQSEVNFDTIVNQNIHFAFFKATEGRNYIDPLFKINWDESARVGLRRGAYHFFSPSIPARQQAAHFVRHVKLEHGDLPPVLDFESTANLSREQIVESLTQWIEVVEKSYGLKPIIYTNYKLYNKYIAGTFDTYPIWIAKYGLKKPTLGGSQPWQFWQYDNNAILGGVKGPIDMNVFNGTLQQLDSLCLNTKPTNTLSGITPKEISLRQSVLSVR